jgi:hypothetical protein
VAHLQGDAVEVIARSRKCWTDADSGQHNKKRVAHTPNETKMSHSREFRLAFIGMEI